MSNRLTDVQLEAAFRWVRVIGPQKLSGIQVDRLSAALAELTDLRTRLAAVEAERDAAHRREDALLVTVREMRADGNLSLSLGFATMAIKALSDKATERNDSSHYLVRTYNAFRSIVEAHDARTTGAEE